MASYKLENRTAIGSTGNLIINRLVNYAIYLHATWLKEQISKIGANKHTQILRTLNQTIVNKKYITYIVSKQLNKMGEKLSYSSDLDGFLLALFFYLDPSWSEVFNFSNITIYKAPEYKDNTRLPSLFNQISKSLSPQPQYPPTQK